MMTTQRQIAANRANRKRWRRHSLSGLRRLRQAAIRNRPWEQSTGPRTQAGKNRSKRNALKHGCFSAKERARKHLMAELMKRISSVIGTPKTKLQTRLKKARKVVRSGHRSPARNMWAK